MNIRALKRVWWYINKFGVARGTNILLKTSSKKEHVGVSVPGYPHPIFFRGGTSDVPTFEQVLVGGEYAVPFPNPSPRLIVDAGANAGYATIFFAQKFPGARIIAVEPDPDNFAALTRNTEHYPNVTRVKAGLWYKKGRLKILDEAAEKWAIRTGESPDGDAQAVEAVTVQELMSAGGQDYIDILKIDIETAEKELFESGYEGWLGKVGMIMIELHDNLRPGCSTSFYRATSQYHFKQSISGENIILERY